MNVTKIINLSNIIPGQGYKLEFNREQMDQIQDHLAIENLRDMVINYEFNENDLFDKTYDLRGTVTATCNLMSTIDSLEEVRISESFCVTLLDHNMTNISKNVLDKLDIDIISDNQVDIADIAIQYLSLGLYM